MFPPTDNPAKRLLDILNEARTKGNQPISKLWGSVFEIEEIDTSTCYRILGHLNSLVDSVEIRVKQIEGLNHELYLRDLPTIRQIICPRSLDENWNNLKKPLDTGVLTGLEFCANELSQIHSEEEVPDEDIERIRGEFSKLFEEVSSANLDPNLKLILYDLLTSALMSLDQYEILGNDGLKRTIAYTLGVLTLHRDEFISAKEKGIVKKTMSAIKSLCDVVALACKVKELQASVQSLLE
jgi:hypothetical protein